MIDNIPCPGCERRLQIDDGLQGQMVQCPACQTSFRAGDPLPAKQPPPAVIVLLAAPPTAAPSPPKQASPQVARPRGERRTRHVAPPKKKSSKAPAILAGVGIAAVAVFFMIVMLPSERDRNPFQFNGGNPNDPFQFNDPVRIDNGKVELAVVENALLPEAPQLIPEIKPLLDNLSDALAKPDKAKAAALFDFEHLHDELNGRQLLPLALRNNREFIVTQLGEGVEKVLQNIAAAGQWRDSEIRSVKQTARDEAVVISRHTHAKDGTILRYRWWLAKTNGAWRVYDFEDMLLNTRISFLFGTIFLATTDTEQREVRARFEQLTAASVALQQERLDLAEIQLNKLDAARLPPTLKAQHRMFTGCLLLRRGQAQQALDHFEAAYRVRPDMPCLDLYRGVCHCLLGNWQTALKYLDAFHTLLGDDDTVCFERGEALRGVRRFDEAADSYRKSLDLHPKNANALVGLLQAIPPEEGADEIAERFVKLDEHRKSFDLLSEACRKARDGATLEPLALALRKIDPDHPQVDISLALAKAWNQKAEEAPAHFKAALAKEKDALARQALVRDFTQAMADAGLGSLAYPVLTDSREAFQYLASRAQYHEDELRALTNLHAKKHPDDPLLKLYQASLLSMEGRHKEAAKAFEAAIAEAPNQASLDLFLDARVTALYHTDQALVAYAKVAPARETVLHLATLCFRDRKFDLLQTILDKHAQAVPDDEPLLRTRIQLAVKRGKIDEGIRLFKTAHEKQADAQQQRLLQSMFLFLMCEEGKALDGYFAAPDPSEAIRSLSDDLLDMNQMPMLRQVLDAHAKRRPDDPWGAYFLAELLAHENDWKGAANALARIAMDPSPQLLNESKHLRLLVMRKNGEGLKAYAQLEPRKETYIALANQYLFDKDAIGLEALVEAHRPHAGNDADFVFDQAQAKLLAKKPGEALPLFQQACKLQGEKSRRQGYVTQYLRAMADLGQSVEGYRACPDPAWALRVLAGELVLRKNGKVLEKLLQEHAAKDAHWRYLQRELHLLRKEPGLAEQAFLASLDKAPRLDRLTCLAGLQRARVQAGRGVDAYRESKSPQRDFTNLASWCIADKDGKQLADLVDAHRAKHPGDTSLFAWELDLQWLRHDYEGLAKKLAGPREGVLASPAWAWKADRYLVHSLAKLKRFQEAIKHAEAHERSRRGDDMLLIFAHAAAGDVKQVIAQMERSRRDSYFVEDCYRDAELGPILRSDAFAPFRAKHPEPKPGEFR